MLPYYLNLASIIAFAITGALAAIQSKKEIDIIAVIILGVVTAVGGGTARDVILNFEVFWVKDPTMLVTAVGASIVTFFFRSGIKKSYSLLLYIDALANALLLVSVRLRPAKVTFAAPRSITPVPTLKSPPSEAEPAPTLRVRLAF